MIIGTTPTHTFTIPFDASLIKTVKIVYAQNDVVAFEKRTEDCELQGNTISTTLSQEDTFTLNHEYAVQIQLRVLTTMGQVLSSIVYETGVAQCLDSEVLL